MLLDLEPVEVSSLFVNSLSIIREKAAARHIRLALEAAEDLGSIEADARKVKQIVYNLLSNAVKFTADGGQVTLRAATRAARTTSGQLADEWDGSRHAFRCADSEFAEFLEISVTDTGIGISPEDLEQLFKPFSQIDSGLARKFEGTGPRAWRWSSCSPSCTAARWRWRAPSARARASRSGCRCGAVGRRRCGRCVVRRRRAAPSPRLASDARTALVVEDDLKSAELIRVQLEAEGFTVLHAASAEAGAARSRPQQPLSLITLDIMLPDMDGWEFLGRIKQVPALRRVPVVIISIVAGPHQGLRARRRGGDAEAGLAAGAVRLAGRARAVRRSRTGSRSRCWSSTTTPRPWS